MDSTLSRSDLGEDQKAKQFVQMQNRYLTFKQQLNTYTPPPAREAEGMNPSQREVNLPTSIGDSTMVTALSTSLNPFKVAKPSLKILNTGRKSYK